MSDEWCSCGAHVLACGHCPDNRRPHCPVCNDDDGIGNGEARFPDTIPAELVPA